MTGTGTDSIGFLAMEPAKALPGGKGGGGGGRDDVVPAPGGRGGAGGRPAKDDIV